MTIGIAFFWFSNTVVWGVVLRIGIKIRAFLGEDVPKLPLQRRVTAHMPSVTPWTSGVVEHVLGADGVGRGETIS